MHERPEPHGFRISNGLNETTAYNPHHTSFVPVRPANVARDERSEIRHFGRHRVSLRLSGYGLPRLKDPPATSGPVA